MPLALRVPKAAAKKLAAAGVETVGDLLYYAPMRYYHWGTLTDMSSLEVGDEVTILATVTSASIVKNASGRGVRFVVAVTDGNAHLSATFFAKNPYMLSHHRKLLQPGRTVLMAGKISEYRGAKQIVQPEFEQIEEGSGQDIERRAGRPIPIYRSLGGLPSWKIGSLISLLLDGLEDAQVSSVIPENTRAKHGLSEHLQALKDLHLPQDDAHWRAARRTLAWEEALVLQTALLSKRLAAQREGKRAPSLPTNSESVSTLLQSLPFDLTAGQDKAWRALSAELAETVPMQRLLQGDVGSGKTIVALLLALQAVDGGQQAALLAPTEVLARQHWYSLTGLLAKAGLDIPVHLLTSKRPQAEKDQVLLALASGEPSIVVGTHALIQTGVEIPNLGLVVVDEQHRFGVAQREKLRENQLGVPHLLVMTATPIPRTIAMTVFGDLDTAVIPELPQGRTPVETFLVDERNEAWMERLWQRAREEVDSGGRVYVVTPRIDSDGDADKQLPLGGDGVGKPTRPLPAAEDVVEELRNLPALQGVKIGLAHGRRTPEENARAFADFASGDAPVLVATTVIEVGVDVPEATMMVILEGPRFGLSQLHQLRGRVGRSDRPSVAMVTHFGELPETSAQRLQAIADTTDGFALAEVDLRLRSEGNVLGKAQSGRVSDLRFLSVRKDASLISAARSVAEEILREDPHLVDNPDLAGAVRRRSGEELVWMERT